MAINYNPTTVSDGLVLALDAANRRSYPGSGTAWTDISYRGNNGTLTNGPTFVAPPYNEPFGGAGGVYFDGSGDYIDNTSNYLVSSTTSTFTIEAWIYMTALPTDDALDIPAMISVNCGGGNSSTNYMSFGPISNQKLRIRWYDGTSKNAEGSSTLALNTWYHVACSVSSNTITMFVNGVQETLTGTTTLTNRNGDVNGFALGQTFTYANYSGYISNARVVSGTALYTQNFTPPRVLLSRVPNTSLLTCQGGTIRDASSNNFTITPNGDASAVSYAPYIKFDGTNDYVLASSSNDFDVSASAYSIEMWVYFRSAPSVVVLFGFAGTSTSGNAHLLYSGGTLYWQTRGTGTNQTTYTWTPNIGRWYHLVVSWNGSNSLRMFIDGQQVASNTVSPTINQNGVNIGGASDGYSVDGKISLARILKSKGLTAEEVLQNYNALKGRFGL